MDKNKPVLLRPEALSTFLKVAHGEGCDASGLIDGKYGRVLCWEDTDAKRVCEASYLVAASSDGINITSKGCKIGKISVLQRFFLVLVSFSGSASNHSINKKLEEMKRTLEVQYNSVIAE